MSDQVETKSRRMPGLWLGMWKAHIPRDLELTNNDAKGPEDKWISLNLIGIWN
jgi:hypothetical protein